MTIIRNDGRSLMHRTREYEAFLEKKISSARASLRAGEGISIEDVRDIYVERRQDSNGDSPGPAER